MIGKIAMMSKVPDPFLGDDSQRRTGCVLIERSTSAVRKRPNGACK
jgi:hypothetical protein